MYSILGPNLGPTLPYPVHVLNAQPHAVAGNGLCYALPLPFQCTDDKLKLEIWQGDFFDCSRWVEGTMASCTHTHICTSHEPHPAPPHTRDEPSPDHSYAPPPCTLVSNIIHCCTSFFYGVSGWHGNSYQWRLVGLKCPTIS